MGIQISIQLHDGDHVVAEPVKHSGTGQPNTLWLALGREASVAFIGSTPTATLNLINEAITALRTLQTLAVAQAAAKVDAAADRQPGAGSAYGMEAERG